MTGTRRRPVGDEHLAAAYLAWPGLDHDKTSLRALMLRLHVERLAQGLPSSVISAPPDSSRIGQRLMLTIGEPGLGPIEQATRLAAVTAAIAAYNDICEVLHGRNPEGNPPVADIEAWERAVLALEESITATPAAPPRRVIRPAGPRARSTQTPANRPAGS